MTNNLVKGGVIALMAGVLVSIAAISLASLSLGYDPAEQLAKMMRLPNSYILAALLGGLLGLWLSLGGPRRIAAFSGWLIGVFAALLLWQVGASYVWVIEAVLVAAFGPEAAAFTSLAAFMLLFGVMRWAAGVGMRAATALLVWGAKWETRRVLARAVAAGD